MNKEFKYALDKSSKKFNCPGCQKKSFTQYTYTDSGAYVSDQFGRCDRENNCNYHRHPADDADFKPTPQPKIDRAPATLVAPDDKTVNAIASSLKSALHLFLMGTLAIPEAHLSAWLLGTAQQNTAFILRNREGRTVNIKFVRYTAEGKRDKTPGTTSKLKYAPFYLGKSYLEKAGYLQPDQKDKWQDFYQFERCFYGEHLFDPAKDTCIVESEKTAVIASFFFPGYNWLATGGNHGMKYEQFSIFQGYSGGIYNLVDNDPAGYQKSKTIQWLNQIADIRETPEKIGSFNLLSDMPEGYDIADAIIFQDLRNPAQFMERLRLAQRIVISEETDKEDSGVVPEGELPAKEYSDREFKRAKQVVERIEEADLEILSDEKNALEIVNSLAIFGKDGLKLWLTLYRIGKDTYNKKEAELPFRIAVHKTKAKSAAKLFVIAKDLGIETRLVRVMNPRAAAGAEGNGLADYKGMVFDWPEGITNPTEKEEEHLKAQAQEYGFVEVKNKYFYAKFDTDNERVTFKSISNFVVKPLFLIQSKTDPKRIFEIKNQHGQKYLLDIPTKAMVNYGQFCEFVESQGNFLINANKVQFSRIKSKLYDLTKDAEEIKTLGWHKDGFYAFANGISNGKFMSVDDTGIITCNLETENEDEVLQKHYFIPALSSIYRNEENTYEQEKKFVFVDRKDIDFNNWAQLFYECYGENGIWGMCFYLTSVFRDFIYNINKFFPHLFLFGPPGTGKSTMAWSLNSMFGVARDPFMLNSGTPAGFYRTFAQFRNAVVWMDEYSNSIDPKRVQDLKSAYDGAGHVKAEWSAGGGSSNKTISTPVLSAMIISGQELPIADNALFKRCMLLQYHQTKFTDAETQRLDKLKKLQKDGLSHITAQIVQHRKLVEENYHKVFNEVRQDFETTLAKETGIETRIVLNAAIIATTFKILESKLPLPFGWEKVKAVFLNNIRSQNNLIANAKETNQFWDQVDFLLNTNQIHDQLDFKIKWQSDLKVRIDREKTELLDFTMPDGGKHILYIRLTKIYPLYMQSLRQQGEKKGMDKGSLIHYLSHSKGYLGSVDNTNFNGTSTSAYCFDYEEIKALGYNFERDAKEVPEFPNYNQIPTPTVEF